jgi:hypothetical protein
MDEAILRDLLPVQCLQISEAIRAGLRHEMSPTTLSTSIVTYLDSLFPKNSITITLSVLLPLLVESIARFDVNDYSEQDYYSKIFEAIKETNFQLENRNMCFIVVLASTSNSSLRIKLLKPSNVTLDDIDNQVRIHFLRCLYQHNDVNKPQEATWSGFNIILRNNACDTNSIDLHAQGQNGNIRGTQDRHMQCMNAFLAHLITSPDSSDVIRIDFSGIRGWVLNYIIY